MDNESTPNAYLAVNHDGTSELTFTYQSACELFTDITRYSSHMRSASDLDGEYTPDYAAQYLNADFEPYSSSPSLPQSTIDSTSNDAWSQRLAPVVYHTQNCGDYGNISCVNPMDVTGTSAWNAVDNDQPQSSLTTSFHPVNYPETQAAPVQCSEPICNGTSVPSSTQTTSYPCYSPAPETAGQAPNSASTTSVDGNRYTCNDCRVSPKTKRDYERHLKTNKHKMKGNLSNGSNGSGIPGAAVASTGFHCSVEGCKYHSSTGRAITREDNLRRHVKIVHGMDLGRKSEE